MALSPEHPDTATGAHRVKRTIRIVISVFGDESSDETHERVFSVAGLVGTDAEWAEADALWAKATRGEEFHAAEWEHAKRFDDYKAAAQALIASHGRRYRSVDGLVSVSKRHSGSNSRTPATTPASRS